VSNCTREFGLVDSGKSMADEDNQDFQWESTTAGSGFIVARLNVGSLWL
jgi:hypothetical protein